MVKKSREHLLDDSLSAPKPKTTRFQLKKLVKGLLREIGIDRSGFRSVTFEPLDEGGSLYFDNVHISHGGATS